MILTYLPEGAARQCESPATGLYRPTEHFKQPEPSEIPKYVPFPQPEQTDIPTSPLYRPAVQSEHVLMDDAPVAAEYLPMAQLSHSVAPTAPE